MSPTTPFLLTVFLCAHAAIATLGAEQVRDVREFGATPDGKTLCTRAIQEAVDQCAVAGGGTVYLAAGKWLSGTITMKSHVTLLLDSGCILLGSTNPSDYPETTSAVRSYTDNYVRQSLIAGEDLDDIAIRGSGTIDGNGAAFHWKEYKNRPYVIRLVNCRDVLVENVKLRNSPMWMQHYLACERLQISGITVWNHATYNNDGLDIDACHDVTVSNCMIDSDDDALCLKSTMDRACENVTVTNCVLSSHANAIKMGTESNGGFQNVTITNCTICSPRYSEVTYGRQRGLAGIALEIVDGGDLNQVAISNIVIRGVTVPIFMRLGDRARPFTESAPKPEVGTFRNVSLNNIVATGTSNIGCSITGLPGHAVENVTLSDISLGFEGGGTAEQADTEVQEMADGYPESTMFGMLPAYGFYCRHAKGLRFRNVRLRTEQPDRRPALVLDDVTDAVIDGLDTRCLPDTNPVIRLANTRGVSIRGCRPQAPLHTFLQLTGEATEGVVLVGNDLRLVNRIARIAPEVHGEALVQVANISGSK